MFFLDLLHSCASSLPGEIRVDFLPLDKIHKQNSDFPLAQLHSPSPPPLSFSKRAEKLPTMSDKHWGAIPHPTTHPALLPPSVNTAAMSSFLIGRDKAACHCLHCSLNWPLILDQNSSKSSFLFADPSLWSMTQES